MVIVRLSSGLGNQLFQYAAGRAHQLRVGGRLIGDPYRFSPLLQEQPGRAASRSCALGELNLPIELRRIPSHGFVKVRGYARLRRLVLDRTAASFTDEGGYSDDFSKLPRRVVLDGYFQDQRYLGDQAAVIANEIRTHLASRYRREFTEEFVPLADAAVHLRRGDYLAHPECLPEWFEGYYRRVITQMLESKSVNNVDLYSDDVEFAGRLASIAPNRLRVAPVDRKCEGMFDLWRLSRYGCLAIANSTFSWWAAMLATTSRSRVIAPRRWTTWCPSPEMSLYRPDWIIAE